MLFGEWELFKNTHTNEPQNKQAYMEKLKSADFEGQKVLSFVEFAPINSATKHHDEMYSTDNGTTCIVCLTSCCRAGRKTKANSGTRFLFPRVYRKPFSAAKPNKRVRA